MATQLLANYSEAEKTAYLSAIASLATADRQASDNETQFLQALVQQAGLSPDGTQQVLAAAQDSNDQSIQQNLDVLKDSDLRFSLVTDLISFARADGAYSNKEEAMVAKMSAYLGINPEQKQTLETVVDQAASVPHDEQDPAKEGFFNRIGDKLSDVGIPKGALMAGLLGVVAPMVISRMGGSSNQSSNSNEGLLGGSMGGLLGGAAQSGMGGMLGGLLGSVMGGGSQYPSQGPGIGGGGPRLDDVHPGWAGRPAQLAAGQCGRQRPRRLAGRRHGRFAERHFRWRPVGGPPHGVMQTKAAAPHMGGCRLCLHYAVRGAAYRPPPKMPLSKPPMPPPSKPPRPLPPALAGCELGWPPSPPRMDIIEPRPPPPDARALRRVLATAAHHTAQ